MPGSRASDGSRSPRRGFWSFFRPSHGQPESLQLVGRPLEKPEEKMHKWAEKSRSDTATNVRELMDTMQIADFEKFKMVAVFKCPRSRVAEKIGVELRAKGFPEEVISAVTDGMGEITFYEKIDSHFQHAGKSRELGKSNLYQYAIWGKVCQDGEMEVSMWCITARFKKGSTGTATKNEIEGLKQFMEQETRSDVLQIAAGPAVADHGIRGEEATGGPAPQESMVAYAKAMHKPNGESVHEDELINRMELTGFEKYRMNSSFKCPRESVIAKVTLELQAKKFPSDMIEAVTTSVEDMAFYKKTDENFLVHSNDGRSNFHKFAMWCSSDSDGEMKISMLCVAASFKKKSGGPVTKSEIEVLSCYLGKEACADVLKAHAPDALQ